MKSHGTLEPSWKIMAHDESKLGPAQKAVHPATKGISWESWQKLQLDRIFAEARKAPVRPRHEG